MAQLRARAPQWQDGIMSEKEYRARRLADFPFDVVSVRSKYPSGDYLFVAYNPEIGCPSGYGNSHEEARADLDKQRYEHILWFLKRIPLVEKQPIRVT